MGTVSHQREGRVVRHRLHWRALRESINLLIISSI